MRINLCENTIYLPGLLLKLSMKKIFTFFAATAIILSLVLMQSCSMFGEKVNEQSICSARLLNNIQQKIEAGRLNKRSLEKDRYTAFGRLTYQQDINEKKKSEEFFEQVKNQTCANGLDLKFEQEKQETAKFILYSKQGDSKKKLVDWNMVFNFGEVKAKDHSFWLVKDMVSNVETQHNINFTPFIKINYGVKQDAGITNLQAYITLDLQHKNHVVNNLSLIYDGDKLTCGSVPDIKSGKLLAYFKEKLSTLSPNAELVIETDF